MVKKVVEPMSASNQKCSQSLNVAKFVGFMRNLFSEQNHGVLFVGKYLLLLSEGRMKIILILYYIK